MGLQSRGWVIKLGGGSSSRQVKFNRGWSGVALLGMGSLQGARKRVGSSGGVDKGVGSL